MINRSWTLVSVAALTLSACFARPSPLPPEEVLHRATTAIPTLTSARYTVDGTLGFSGGAFGEGGGTVHMDGILNDGGRLHQTDVHVSLHVTTAGDDRTVEAQFRTVLPEDGSTYVRFDALPESSVDAALLGKWWLLSEQGDDAVPVTPSAGLLAAQASVVTVTRDRGLQEMGEDDVYRYDVQLSSEKLVAYAAAIAAERGEPFDAARAAEEAALLQATGELWIDANSFVPRKIHWIIPSWPLADGTVLRLDATITLRDMNAAPAVELPSSAERLPGGTGILPLLTPSTVPPDGSITEEELRRNVLQQSDTAVFPPSNE